MRTDMETQAEHEIVAFLASGPSLRAIVAFHASPEVADRCYELIDAERERALTDEEQRELDHYLYLNHLMILMKAEAHRLLGDTPPKP